MNRRKFMVSAMQGLGSFGLANTFAQLYSAPLWAQSSSSYKAVVCLFLDGGVDSNSTVVPMDNYYAQYAAPRQDLVYRLADLNPLQATSSKRMFGLHPALKQTAALFNSNEAAILANVGSLGRPLKKTDQNFASELPDNLYSHPAQIGAWESSMATAGSSTGWAGRVADELLLSGLSGKMPAVVSVAGYHLVGQGKNTDQLMTGDGNNAVALANTLAMLQPFFEKAESGGSYNNIQNFLRKQQQAALTERQIVVDTLQAGSVKTVFPSSSIGQQLQVVAEMIAGKSAHNTQRQIFVARDGSYDSHNIQYNLLNDRLTGLDAAIAAFVTAMKEIGMYDKVTLFTCSDFGRSLVQNNTGGSDHAWGGHHFICGGAVKGGDMYGAFPSLEIGGSDDLTNIGTWIPSTSMSQYAATMAGWLGVNGDSLRTIFPDVSNFSATTLPMLKTL